MNLMFVVTKGEVGGAQKHVFSLAKNFAKKDNVIIVDGSGTWLEQQCKKHHISHSRLEQLQRTTSFFEIFTYIFTFRTFVKKQKPSVVHFHSSNSFFGIFSLFFLKNKPKTIIAIHGWSILNPGWKKSRIIKLLYWIFIKITYQFVDEVIYISRFDKSFAKKHFLNHQNEHLIYNGIESIPFLEKKIAKQKLLLPQNKYIIGTIARLDYPKNLDLFIDIAKKFENKQIHWVILGNGPEKENLQNRIIKEYLEDKISLVTEIETPSLYFKAFDIFLLTSRYEGLPYTILESALAEIPIISTNVGGISEIIEHKKTGLISEPTVEAFQNEINFLKNEPKLISIFTTKAKQKVLKKFSEKKMIKKIEKFYRQ